MRKIPALIVVALCLAPVLAHAATTVSTEELACGASGSALSQTLAMPCSSDWWRQALESIFPGVGPLSGNASQSSSGLQDAMSAFLAVMMAVGTGMMTWHFISGTVATAHEGTVLGQRWHTVWAPLRLCYGVGMLAPAAKGFCIAQVLVIYAALYGGSLGNLVWEDYLRGLVTPNFTSAPPLPATGALVKDFAQAELCRQAILAQGHMIGWPSSVPEAMPQPVEGGTTGENISVSLGNVYNVAASYFTGGSIESSAQSNRHLVTWDYGVCGRIQGTFAVGSGGDATVTAFDKARLTAIAYARRDLSRAITPYIQQQINPPADGGTFAQRSQTMYDEFTAGVDAAKKDIDTGFQTAAQILVDARGGTNSPVLSLMNDTNKYGWMTSGMLYMSISRLQSAAFSLASDVPQYTIPPMQSQDTSGHIDQDSWSGARQIMEIGEDVLQSKTIDWNATDDTADLRNAALAGSTQGSTTSLHGVQKWLFDKVFSLGDKYLVGLDASGAHGSPLQQLSAFGNAMLNIVGGIIFAGIGVAAFSGVGLGAVATLVSSGPLSWLGIVMLMLLGVGVEHAYIIPMAPFIEFSTAFFAIVISVCEAFVVAPIWAFLHIRMDGSEFVNEPQRSGYAMILSLFLRIPMTIFGLIFSLSILNVGSEYISRTFAIAVSSGTADTGGGIIGAVTMLIIEGWMFWKLTTLSTRVITTMPEMAAKFVGWHLDSPASQNPSQFVGGVVSRTSGAAGHSVAHVGGKGGKQPKTPEAGGAMSGQAGGSITSEPPAAIP